MSPLAIIGCKSPMDRVVPLSLPSLRRRVARHGCQVCFQSGSDWPQLGQICDFSLFRSDSPRTTMCQNLTWKYFRFLSHLGSNLTHFLPKSAIPASHAGKHSYTRCAMAKIALQSHGKLAGWWLARVDRQPRSRKSAVERGTPRTRVCYFIFV